MREVVSTIGSPAYGTSKYLVKIVQPILNKNKHRVHPHLWKKQRNGIYHPLKYKHLLM